MTGGLLALSGSRKTSEPHLAAFLTAQHVNQAAGGTVVTPWEVDELPMEWIEAANGLMLELPGMRKGRQTVDKILEKWRKEHARRGPRGTRGMNG